jgi:hypothetical protein
MTQRSGPRGPLSVPDGWHRMQLAANQVPTNGRGEMDQLQQLVETLRRLARTNEPNRVVLIEKAINEYLDDKAGIVRLSLERLCDAIDREEAEKRRGEDWSIARDYVRSRLRRLA